MTRVFAVLILLASLLTRGLYAASVELRNILTVDGFQDNPILGYGLVVGLKGTGDSENGSQTKEILSRIANNFGIQINSERLKPKNSAVVIVSAMLSPLSQSGSRLDVRVSSVYDAKSLEGGELIVTPLIGGDNAMYAVAQGAVQTEKNAKGVMGFIPMGAIIQKQVATSVLNANREISVSVQDTLGFSAISKTADAIRQQMPDSVQRIENNLIVLKLPEQTEVLPFLTELMKIKVELDEEPSVLIDSRTGTVVSGGQVQISEAAISYNGTRITVGSTASGGDMKILRSSVSVQELVEAVNQVGISGPDIAKILQMLYRNGNLKARLVVQ